MSEGKARQGASAQFAVLAKRAAAIAVGNLLRKEALDAAPRVIEIGCFSGDAMHLQRAQQQMRNADLRALLAGVFPKPRGTVEEVIRHVALLQKNRKPGPASDHQWGTAFAGLN